MGKSYPDRYNSSGVWKINEISKNRQTNKNFPRGHSRMVQMGGQTPTYVNTMSYITMETLGNASDFGDMSTATIEPAAVGSATRGVFAGGRQGNNYDIDTMEFFTIMTTGNAADFGNLSAGRQRATSLNNDTRGVFGGGATPTIQNVIDFITIASLGNATDFGDMTTLFSAGGGQSNTRGVFMGGGPSYKATIDFIEIATTGNSADFGDLTRGCRPTGNGTSNRIKAITMGGEISGGADNIIEFINIASTGNGTDFGDMAAAVYASGCAANSTKGIAMAGLSGGQSNVIQFITWASHGNAVDFGDDTVAHHRNGACSNAGGGLNFTN